MRKALYIAFLGIALLATVPALQVEAACTFGCGGGGSPVKCGTCSGYYMANGLLCYWYQVACIDCVTGEYIYEGDFHVECYI
jgi:hypothetical protein